MSCRVIIYIHLQASRAKLKARWLQYPNTTISKILHQRYDFGDDTSSGSKLLVIFLGILLKTSPNLSPDVFQGAMFRWMDGWMDGCVWPLSEQIQISNVWILPCHPLKSTIKRSFIFTLLLVQLSCDRQCLYSKANSICMNACIYTYVYITFYTWYMYLGFVYAHRCYM